MCMRAERSFRHRNSAGEAVLFHFSRNPQFLTDGITKKMSGYKRYITEQFLVNCDSKIRKRIGNTKMPYCLIVSCS